MRRIFGILIAVLLLIILIYMSRYWTFRLWGREGLAGIEVLRPQGALPSTWLRGTPFASFDIVVWGVGGFLGLSILQSIWSRIFKDH